MTRKERELLTGICDDIEASDDKIDALERLYREIKRIKDCHKAQNNTTV